MGVHGDPIRIAVAHRVNLGSRLRRSGWKEVPCRDSVSPVGLRVDANDLPTQVIGVPGRFLGVPWHPSRPFVDRSVASSERIRVVAGGQVEIALGVEGDRAAGVTALQSLRSHLEQDLLRCEVQGVSFHLEAGEHVLRIRSGGRVVHVDPAVCREVRVGGESEQAVFRLRAVRVFGADRDRRDSSGAPVSRRIEVHVTVSLDEQHALARQNGELDGFVQFFCQNDFREPILLRPRATEVDRARSHCVPQAAEQMSQEERLGVRRLGVAHVRVPRASAIEVVVPAHGMVVAVGPALVALLVDLDERMNGRIDRLEVVELVFTHERVGKSLGGGMTLVENAIGGFANVGISRMPIEPGAGESAVPRPVVLGVRGRMDSHVSAAGLDVALEIVLLRGVEYVAGGVQKDNRAISREILRREGGGVFGRVDGEPVLLPQLADGGASDTDGAVSESGRLGEDEHARLLSVCGGREANESEQKHERGEALHRRSRAMVDDQRTGGTPICTAGAAVNRGAHRRPGG